MKILNILCGIPKTYEVILFHMGLIGKTFRGALNFLLSNQFLSLENTYLNRQYQSDSIIFLTKKSFSCKIKRLRIPKNCQKNFPPQKKKSVPFVFR